MPSRAQLRSIEYNIKSLGLKSQVERTFGEQLQNFILEEGDYSKNQGATASPEDIQNLAQLFVETEWEDDWLSRKSPAKSKEEIQAIIERIIRRKKENLRRRHRELPSTPQSSNAEGWISSISEKVKYQKRIQTATEQNPDIVEVEEDLPPRTPHPSTTPNMLTTDSTGTNSTEFRERRSVLPTDVFDSPSDLNVESGINVNSPMHRVPHTEQPSEGSSSSIRSVPKPNPRRSVETQATRKVQSAACRPHAWNSRDLASVHNETNVGPPAWDDNDDTINAYRSPQHRHIALEHSYNGDSVDLGKRARIINEEDSPRFAQMMRPNTLAPQRVMMVNEQQPRQRGVMNTVSDSERIPRPYEALPNNPRQFERRLTVNPPHLLQHNRPAGNGMIHIRTPSFVPSGAPSFVPSGTWVQSQPHMVNIENEGIKMRPSEPAIRTWMLDMSEISGLRDYYLKKARVLGMSRKRENRSMMTEEELKLAALNHVLSTLEDCSHAGHRVIELR